MAVAAIDAETADVMLVAEGHRLCRRHSDVRVERRKIERVGATHGGKSHRDNSRQRDTGDRVGMRWKELCHLIGIGQTTASSRDDVGKLTS
jgi:hypothetical protein